MLWLALVGTSTAYTRLHEAINLLAALAPDVHEALAAALSPDGVRVVSPLSVASASCWANPLERKSGTVSGLDGRLWNHDGT